MGTRRPPPLAAFLFLGLLLACTPRLLFAQSPDSPAYIALGDSLAAGIGATNPATDGYVGLTATALRQGDYSERGLALVNLAVPGAKSGDLLAPGGQLDQALAEIGRRQEGGGDDDVELISIDIGGNDLLALAAPGSPCLQNPAGRVCLEALSEMLGRLQFNLSQVLGGLHEAAPDARIYVLDLYNPYSGTGDVLEPLADAAVQQLNGVVRATVAGLGREQVNLASVDDLFQGRGKQWVAADHIHPNDNGHLVISEVLLGAILDREPQIPRELLDVPPDNARARADADPGSAAAADGDTPLWLIVAIPAAFVAGAALSGAYFLARGR